MSDEILGLYVMIVSNMKMNYQILSYISDNKEELEWWRNYINKIDDSFHELKKLKEKKD